MLEDLIAKGRYVELFCDHERAAIFVRALVSELKNQIQRKKEKFLLH